MSLYTRLKLTRHKPSSDFADANEGQLFALNGKKYVLVGRDPWVAYLIRWFWWDHAIYRLKERLRRTKQKTS